MGKHQRLMRKPCVPTAAIVPPEFQDPKYFSSEGQGLDQQYFNGLPEVQRSINNSIISPPPPSELISRHGSHKERQSGSLPRQISYIRKGDLKYVLDPLISEKTNLGTYIEGKHLVKPYQPRGPKSFPARLPKQPMAIQPSMLFDNDIDRYTDPPVFVLEDFLKSLSDQNNVPLNRTKEIVYSKHNYKKIQKMIVDAMSAAKSSELSFKDVRPPSALNVQPRIPQRQILIEMAAFIKEQASDLIGNDMKAVIRPMPKFNPNYKVGETNPHTEIVLYEDNDAGKTIKDAQLYIEDSRTKDKIFHSGVPRYFQDSKRSDSPFRPADPSQIISPAEVAVLDSLMNGGNALSLKANFISEMPNIQILVKTLTYLNLSFNEFTSIPPEVFDIRGLTVLKMRNNPIREIPNEIVKLKNLTCIVFSYCLLGRLPPGLFQLSQLKHLDVSYNRIASLQNEISQLSNLREFSVEGNQLPALPFGCLKLDKLKHLRLHNNFMHPLFWKENSINQPQRLVDLSALEFSRFQLGQRYKELPVKAFNVLVNETVCECCRGPKYGMGLRIIRPVSKIFGIKNLPFIFHSCSPNCLKQFISGAETLAEILYGSVEEL